MAEKYNTDIGGMEPAFRQWLKQNQVPFDPNARVSDYDMRGFYAGLQNGNPHATQGVDPNDKRMHYSDYWKTPLHQTFSNESQWAGPNAPRWIGDQLVAPGGRIQYDDANRGKLLMSLGSLLGAKQ